MKSNPYKYKGPLEPDKDRLVCVPREDDISRLLNGIDKGEYWAVLGPKQIGKTTLLRQLQQVNSNAQYIYFNLEAFDSTKDAFYLSLMNEFYAACSTNRKKITTNKWPGNPELEFRDFLVKFKHKNENDKLILMFDEIDNLSFLSTFLHFWRHIFHERYHKKELCKYIVIITGSVDLIAQTIGKTSPFNIAGILTMKDFSEAESRWLIEEPIKQLNLNIEEQAIDYLLAYTSGHPQLLQQACYLLIKNAAENPEKQLTVHDVGKVIKILLAENTSLDTLKSDLNNDRLRQLIIDIINGHKRKYYPNKEYYLAGAGAIKEKDFHCIIRNKIYEDFLNETLPTLGKKEKFSNEQTYKSTHLQSNEQIFIDEITQKLENSKVEIVNHILEFLDKKIGEQKVENI